MKYLVFDTETTGVDVEKDRIIQAGIITPDGEEFLIHINPGVKIPEEAVKIHGITNEFLEKEGVSPVVGLTKIREKLLGDDPIVVFNAPYDLSILDHELERHGIPQLDIKERLIFDPLTIDRGLDRWRKGSRKLVDMAGFYGAEIGTAHDAIGDCKTTKAVFEKMTDKFPNFFNAPNSEIMAAQEDFYVTWAVNYQEFLQKQGKDVKIDTDFPQKKRLSPVIKPQTQPMLETINIGGIA
jgi:DNA polymerase-3 subunit epsilon